MAASRRGSQIAISLFRFPQTEVSESFNNMGNHTPLFDQHVRMGGKIVDFAGWEMPINYGSQIEEHHAVRRAAGMFDVSHMCVVDLTGTQTRAFLRHLLANNIDRLQAPGKALYSCMLNARGGVIDDLIVYFLREDFAGAVFWVRAFYCQLIPTPLTWALSATIVMSCFGLVQSALLTKRIISR